MGALRKETPKEIGVNIMNTPSVRRSKHLLFIVAGVAALAAAAATRVSGFQTSRSGPKPVPAEASRQETSGALQILDKAGKPAGFCPLKHTDVVADIAGYVSRVTVTQRFANPSKEPIEAVYTFPLPEDAAVDDMTMVIGKRIIKGQIMRREDARQVYEEAKSRGQAAALLDQERPNIFTQSVANIMPGSDVLITISYVNLLKYEEGRYEFTFPMVVGPRFTPSGGYRTPGQRGAPSKNKVIYDDPGSTSVVTDADKITPPITPPGTRAGHDISITVNLDAGMPLREVKSALHKVNVKAAGPNRAVVKLEDEKTIPNKDFVLRYSAAGSEIAEGILTYVKPGSQDGYFTLVMQPPAAPPSDMVSPKEMVFVIDQTGSQSGWPIKKAKETMAYCLKNLNPQDTFQLIGFNTEVFPCFKAPVRATKANIEKALKWLEPIEGRGGTDILKSVDYALSIPRDKGRLRIICYLTDGYVGNDMQIIEFIGKHRGEARMFPIGIGNSVNRFLIEGMAREGKGAPDYVFLDASGADHAARFYRRIASPLLLDVSVDWGGLPVEEVYPRYIPDVFTAGPVVLKGRYTRAAEGYITVRGLLRGQPWSRRIKVTLPPVDADGSAISTLWAREKIEDLQRQDWVGAQTGNPKLDIKDAIVRVALEHRLMSQYTSFVAVEQRVINIGGKQRTVDVPVEMPEGVAYEGIFGAEHDRESMPAVMGMRGGFGGGAVSPQLATKAASSPRMSLGRRTRGDSGALNEQLEAERRKAPEHLTPEQQRTALRKAKLSAALFTKLAKGTTGKLEVQVWLSSMPKDGLAKLREAGFVLVAQLRPGKLLLGTMDAAKVDALLALEFVRAVEEPRMR
jgi:Ca-activated chloride channel family protein